MDNAELTILFRKIDPILVDVFHSALEHSFHDNHLMALRHAKGFNALLALYKYHQRDLPAPFYNRPIDDVIREAKQVILERHGVVPSEWDGDGVDHPWVVE